MSDTNPKTISEKLHALKIAHKKSHPSAKQILSDWEDQMINLRFKDDWLNHDCTKELLGIVVEQIKILNRSLMENESLSEFDRKVLFAARDIHQIYIAALTEDVYSQIAELENQINYEYNEYDQN